MPDVATHVLIDHEKREVVINGQSFPYYIHENGPQVRLESGEDFGLLTIPIVVNGPIVEFFGADPQPGVPPCQ